MKKRTTWLLVASVLVVSLGAAAFGAGALLLRNKWGGGMAKKGAAGQYLRINLQGELQDAPPADLHSILEHRELSLQQIVEGLDRAAHDAKIKGVLVKVGPLSDSGWGAARELHDAISRFRESGKPIYAHIEYCGDKEYYVAAACSRVYAVPEALIDVAGLAVQATFFRKTLDKLGIEAQFEGVGKYKNAPNTYTETTFTEPHREQMQALLDSLFATYVAGLAKSRGRTEAQVLRMIDEGPYDGDGALKAGLVDGLLYGEELEKKLEDASAVGARQYLKSRPGFGWGREKLALIYVLGEIVPGKSGSSLLGGTSFAGSDTLAAAIRQARDDAAIKAIVVRIDSPGGVATASDVIWREMREARRIKPVIASLGDVAASGGYYIAMGADAIVTQPTTITGSIGVFGGKLNLHGLYDKLGITKETLTRGRFADLYSDYRRWDDEERARVRAMLVAFYHSFIDKAAQGRNRKPEEIEKVAQGRVWTGAEALNIGLADRLGDLKSAIALARERAKIPASSEVALVVLPEHKGWLEAFLQQDEEAAALRYVPAELRSLLSAMERSETNPVLARMPFDIRID
jgi:protease-4